MVLPSPPSLLSVSRRDDVVRRRRTSGTVSRPLVGHVPCPRFLPDASRPCHAAPFSCACAEDGRSKRQGDNASCRAPLLHLTYALAPLLPLWLAKHAFPTSLSTPFPSPSRIELSPALRNAAAASHGRRPLAARRGAPSCAPPPPKSTLYRVSPAFTGPPRPLHHHPATPERHRPPP